MANKTPRKKPDLSDTTRMPAVSDDRRDPPLPPTLPEDVELGGATGAVQVIGEGEDINRNDDDSATASDVARQ